MRFDTKRVYPLEIRCDFPIDDTSNENNFPGFATWGSSGGTNRGAKGGTDPPVLLAKESEAGGQAVMQTQTNGSNLAPAPGG